MADNQQVGNADGQDQDPDINPVPQDPPQGNEGADALPEQDIPDGPFFGPDGIFGAQGNDFRQLLQNFFGSIIQIAVAAKTIATVALPALTHAVHQARFMQILQLIKLRNSIEELTEKGEQWAEGYTLNDYPDEEADTYMTACGRLMGRNQAKRPKEYVIPEFDGKTPEEWSIWRDMKFRRLVRLNQWTDAKAKQILPTLFKGAYQQNLSQVDVEATNDQGFALSLNEVLRECDKVILPPSETALAQQQALSLSQEEDESLAAFFSRFRGAFYRAFPEAGENDYLTKHIKLETLARGIANKAVRERVHAHMTSLHSMDDMLQYAQDQEAALMRDKAGKERFSVNSIKRKAANLNNGKNSKRRKGNGPAGNKPGQGQNQPKGTNPRSVVCGACGNKGHLESTCWNKKGQEHLKAVMQAKRSDAGKTKGKSLNAMHEAKQEPGQENS